MSRTPVKRRARVVCRAEAPRVDDPLWCEVEASFEKYARLPMSMGGSVYAIVMMCSERPIKIGYSTDVGGRIRALQTGSPFGLHVLGTQRGGEETEELIHRYLMRDRLLGEWFAPSARVMGVVSKLNARTVVMLPTTAKSLVVGA